MPRTGCLELTNPSPTASFPRNRDRGVGANIAHCRVRLKVLASHERASTRLVASMIIRLLMASKFSDLA